MMIRMLFWNGKSFKILNSIVSQMQFSNLLSELQNDSDDDQSTRDLNVELPFQDDSHFKNFEGAAWAIISLRRTEHFVQMCILYPREKKIGVDKNGTKKLF